MNCNKCKNPILLTDKYCQSCGALIDEENLNIVKDDELLSAFIGSNRKKIENSQFSVPTLFLGSLYFLYRKMYILTAIWFVLEFVLTLLLPKISVLILLVLNALVACFFNKWYIKHVNKKVLEIKKANENKNFDEVKKLCQKRGGTTMAPLFISIAFFIIGFISSFFYIFKEMFSSFEIEESHLSYNIPLDFKLESSDNYESVFSSLVDPCKFSVKKLDSTMFLSPQDYIIDRYENENITLMQINLFNINKQLWAYVKLEEDLGVKDIYVTLKDGYIYEVVFNTFEESDSCDRAQVELKNSLKFSVLEEL